MFSTASKKRLETQSNFYQADLRGPPGQSMFFPHQKILIVSKSVTVRSRWFPQWAIAGVTRAIQVLAVLCAIFRAMACRDRYLEPEHQYVHKCGQN